MYFFLADFLNMISASSIVHLGFHYQPKTKKNWQQPSLEKSGMIVKARRQSIRKRRMVSQEQEENSVLGLTKIVSLGCMPIQVNLFL